MAEKDRNKIKKVKKDIPLPFLLIAELITEEIRDVCSKAYDEEKNDEQLMEFSQDDDPEMLECMFEFDLCPNIEFGPEGQAGAPIFNDSVQIDDPPEDAVLEPQVVPIPQSIVNQCTVQQPVVPSASSVGPTRQGLKRLIVLEGDDQVDDDELRDYKKKNRNKNTRVKTEQIARRFHTFLREKYNEHRLMETIPPERLNFYIGNFLLTIRKDTPAGVDPATLPLDQVEYQPETLTSYHRAIARHLRDEGYPYDIMKAEEFVSTKGVLSTKKGELKAKGLGNLPNACVPMGEAETLKCWEVGSLGSSTPRILQNTIFYILATTFGWRARHEANQCLLGDLEIKKGADEREFIEWNERATKTRNGDSEPRLFPPKVWATCDDRCIIRLFRLYLTKRPAEKMDEYSALFLTPKRKTPISAAIGYINGKMGANSLAEIMAAIAKAAEVPGRVAGHTIRKTMCNKLYQAGVPPTMICHLSGHANINSLQRYTMPSTDQQQAMSDIMTNPVLRNFNDVMAEKRGGSGASSTGFPTAREVPPCTVQTPAICYPPGPSMTSGISDKDSSSSSNRRNVQQVQETDDSGIYPGDNTAREVAPCSFSAPGPSSPDCRPAFSVLPRKGSMCTSVRDMEQNARAMLAGAVIHGDVHININYNVAGGHQNTQVNQNSPKLPVNVE